MDQIYIAHYLSPIGNLEIVSTKTAITSILFVESCQERSQSLPPVLQACLQELDEYFNDDRTFFTVETQQQGTHFQQSVWDQLTQIPFGTTQTYLEIAQRLHNEKSVRAVGYANSKNQLCILVPCHRVIGTNGKLTGYAGGLWRKQWLLEHERRQMFPSLFDHPYVQVI